MQKYTANWCVVLGVRAEDVTALREHKNHDLQSSSESKHAPARREKCKRRKEKTPGNWWHHESNTRWSRSIARLVQFWIVKRAFRADASCDDLISLEQMLLPHVKSINYITFWAKDTAFGNHRYLLFTTVDNIRHLVSSELWIIDDASHIHARYIPTTIL